MPRRTKKPKKTSLKVRVKKTVVKKAKKKDADVTSPTIGDVKSDVKNSARPKKNKTGQRIDVNKIERDKRMIMWSGVTFFMVLILFFWTYNMKQVFQKTNTTDEDFSLTEWQEMTSDIKEKMKQIKEDIKELEPIENNIDEQSLPDSDQVEALKEKLLATTTVATTTEIKED